MLGVKAAAVLLLGATAAAVSNPRPWLSHSAGSPETRATLLLNAMNLSEKLHMLAGNNTMFPYVGAVTGNERLGIPALTLNDGPQGFRGQRPFSPPGSSTAWPSGLTIGATWDVEAAQAWGKGMGEEFAGKGSNVQLGPGVCLARIPNDGRNFEYISGEDPFLGMTMVAPAVRGIQGEGVIANAKHWVNNNQETNRTTQTAHVDERTQFEMYYPPFEGAVNAGVGSVMCSYNLIAVDGAANGERWSCENEVTLGHLKKTLNFSGWVMSDWGATHSASIVEGLDQEMPGGSKMRNVLDPVVTAGNISVAVVNASVLRILTPMFRMGLFDGGPPSKGSIGANVTSPEHNALARSLAAKSMVLLQNNNSTLPINKAAVNTVAVFGEQAISPIIHGDGSGQVFPAYVSAPLDAIRAAFETSTPAPNVCGAPQQLAYNQADLPGWHNKTGTAGECCAACLAWPNGACHAYTWTKTGSDGNCYLKSAPNQPRPTTGSTSATIGPPACPAGQKCVTFNDGSAPDSVAKDAAAADVSIVFVATTSGEGMDRNSLSLDNKNPGQLDLIAAVAAAAKRVVVVMVHPGAVTTPFRTQVDSIVAAFMPGQEYGNAIADVLFGAVNPSGKLPLTFPDTEAQYSWTQNQWPGAPALPPDCMTWATPGSDGSHCRCPDPKALQPNGSSTYSERLLVGYRFFDAHALAPAFPFGAGLSYTTFAWSGLVVTQTSAHFTLTNTGKVDGAEVCQLYLGFPAAAGEPPSQLKGFVKVALAAGATQTVTIPLTPRSFSVWDVASHGWTVVPGLFEVRVGASSRDIKLSATLQVPTSE